MESMWWSICEDWCLMGEGVVWVLSSSLSLLKEKGYSSFCTPKSGSFF